ncbi:Alpha/Beta hydrolase protein [Phakopsora pachyrhizi]|uniref:Alpha/Beta hydrolase protein n=1 Tax=Phakopsora pachyrhizi TaxID=170000 RepID=A0AAV0B9M1_PHAPC|nr:Alpha/Beta hydrolase protein [Phakopsora pachyrhizi]
MVNSAIFFALLPFLVACVYASVTPLIKERATEPWLNLPSTPSLPGNPVGKTALINGVNLWYAEFGNVHSKDVPVLLLHGGFGNSDYFGSVIPLISQTRRIIAMDTRGHGRSTLNGQKLTYDIYASDATGLLKFLGIPKAAFVGWSDMGVGTIAAMMGSSTSTFVERAFLYGAFSNIKASNEAYSGTNIFKQFVTRASAEYLKYQPRGDLKALQTALLTLYSTLPLYTASDLAKIKLGNKVTVCFGEHEEAIKLSELDALPKMIVGSNRVIIKGVSHFGMLQNPAAVAREINNLLAQK